MNVFGILVFGILLCHSLSRSSGFQGDEQERMRVCIDDPLGCYPETNPDRPGNSFKDWRFIHFWMSSRSKVGTEFRYWAPGQTSAVAITNWNFHVYFEDGDGFERGHRFDPTLRTYFVIHGFNGGNAAWAVRMKDALMHKEACNVFIVDWSGGASRTYGTARANTWVVGAELGRFVERLGNITGLKPSQMHLIGHSLGAHIAGLAGSWLSNKKGTKFARITGLDPAGEEYTDVNKNERLDKEDADFVDIIHTNYADSFVEGYGLEKAIGHFDFYPNGGENQPGCMTVLAAEGNVGGVTLAMFNPVTAWMMDNRANLKDATDKLSCSHTRAVYLFIESILNQGCRFLATECASWQDYEDGKCPRKTHVVVPMGFDSEKYKSLAKSNESRKFYLTTNGDGVSTFCQQ